MHIQFHNYLKAFITINTGFLNIKLIKNNRKDLKNQRIYHSLVYTTRVNSAFRARWLAVSEVVSECYSLPCSQWYKRIASQESNFRPFFVILTEIYSLLGFCVVYTKAIIHPSVSESAGYLPPLRWITVKYGIVKYFERSSIQGDYYP